MTTLTIRSDNPEAEIGLFELSQNWQSSNLDGVQGADEQRSEPYSKYDERVAESATQQSAKSNNRVTGSASKQVGAVREIAYIKWQAHRELAETIHKKLADILNQSSKTKKDIKAVIVYKGPGSFTGLRIGMSVANALAYGLNIPIVSTTGANWIKDGVTRLEKGENEKIAMPKYGAPVNITEARK